MLEVLLVFGAAILGAFGRRLAGGLGSQWLGKDLGTQPQRLIWGISTGLTVLACGQPWYVALAALVSVVVSSAIFGYAAPWVKSPTTMSMGHAPGDPNGPVSMPQFWRDFGWMTYHGVGGVLFLTIGSWYLGLFWPAILAAGVLCAPCYTLAYVVKPNIPWLGMLNAPEKGLVDAPPAGEFLWGALVGVGVALSILV